MDDETLHAVTEAKLICNELVSGWPEGAESEISFDPSKRGIKFTVKDMMLILEELEK